MIPVINDIEQAAALGTEKGRIVDGNDAGAFRMDTALKNRVGDQSNALKADERKTINLSLIYGFSRAGTSRFPSERQ
jgi:hypothetical protein